MQSHLATNMNNRSATEHFHRKTPIFLVGKEQKFRAGIFGTAFALKKSLCNARIE